MRGIVCVVLLVVWLLPCAMVFFFVKQKTAYEMRISDWSSDVCFPILRRDVRRFARWSIDVRRWLTSRGRRGRARMGKFNAGQKLNAIFVAGQAEERRVGHECVSTDRSRSSP